MIQLVEFELRVEVGAPGNGQHVVPEHFMRDGQQKCAVDTAGKTNAEVK